MFLFRCQIRISIFIPKEAACPPWKELNATVRCIQKQDWVTTGNTIIGQNTETAYKIILFQSLLKRILQREHKKVYFGIILPAYIVTKSSIIVRTQSQINVIAVQETDIFLNKVAVIIQIA